MLKVFCNACGIAIKDVTVQEARKLTGKEICETCQGRIDQAMQDINTKKEEIFKQIEAVRKQEEQQLGQMNKAYDRTKRRLENVYSAALLELQELVRKVITVDEKK